MTSKQYWEHKFGEPPKTDADKLACAMMAEYHRHERQQLIEGMKRKDRLEILAEVCNDHSLSVDQIRSLSRKTHIVLARTDFIIRAHRNEYTHEEIAEAINRDRSTVSEHITNHYR